MNSIPSDPSSLPASSRSRAFTLIEVVLAVGVVSFAIIAIVALFGSSLQSSRQVIDQDEAIGIARALPAALQAQGFQTVYNWLQSGTGPVLYGYYVLPPPLSGTATGGGVATAQQAIIDTTGSASSSRQGRLFGIVLYLSPGMPIHTSGTTTTYMPSFALSGTTLSAWSTSTFTTGSSSYGWTYQTYPEAVLPIRAYIYDVYTVTTSGSSSIPTGAYPVFTYDTAVSR